MSTITEIQEAIGRLPANEKSALAVWLQSQEEPLMSEAEEAALLASLDQAAAELDAGKGIPIERVREKIRGWANYIFMKAANTEPEIITKNGKRVSAILPIKKYQEMMERLEDAEDVAWLKKARKKPLHYRPLKEYLADRKARV